MNLFYFFIIKTKHQSIITISLSILGYIFSKTHLHSPLNAHQAMFALLFFHLGCKAQTLKLQNHKIIKSLLFIVSLIIFSISATSNPSLKGVASLDLGRVDLFITSSLTGSYCLLSVAKLVPDFYLLRLLSKNTIFILGFNYWVNTFTTKALTLANCQHNWILNFFFQLIILTSASYFLSKHPRISSIIQEGKLFKTT